MRIKAYIPKNDEPIGFWRDIPDTHGAYQISIEGNIRKIWSSGKVSDMVPYTQCNGYKKDKKPRLFIRLDYDGKRRTFSVLSLMVKTFYGNIPKGMLPYHKDGVASNNHINNIGFITKSELGKITGYKSKSKAVFKVNKNGEVIDVYKSAAVAADKNFVSYDTVLRRCNHKLSNEFKLIEFTFRWCEEIEDEKEYKKRQRGSFS